MDIVLAIVGLAAFALLIRHLIRNKTPDQSGSKRFPPKPDDLPLP